MMAMTMTTRLIAMLIPRMKEAKAAASRESRRTTFSVICDSLSEPPKLNMCSGGLEKARSQPKVKRTNDVMKKRVTGAMLIDTGTRVNTRLGGSLRTMSREEVSRYTAAEVGAKIEVGDRHREATRRRREEGHVIPSSVASVSLGVAASH